MSVIEPFELPGPELTDPIVVVGDQAFAAQIAPENWLTVDAPVTVTRDRQGPWPGTVRSFRRSTYYRAEWMIGSGEKRRMNGVDPTGESKVGDEFDVKYVGRTFTATVTHTEPAMTVGVEFAIQSGEIRKRDFFRRGRLVGSADRQQTA